MGARITRGLAMNGRKGRFATISNGTGGGVLVEYMERLKAPKEHGRPRFEPDASLGLIHWFWSDLVSGHIIIDDNQVPRYLFDLSKPPFPPSDRN